MGCRLGGWVSALMLLGSTPVFAALEYTERGKVVVTEPYRGPGVGWAEATALAGLAIGYPALWAYSPIAVDGVATATVLAYGAWRTAKYRPEAVKQRIRTALSAQPPKTRAWLLGQ